MLALILAGTVGSLGWTVYARRIAWHCLGERPITLSVVLQTVAILMLLPRAPSPLGELIHSLTGLWNAQALLAHILCLGADVAIVYHVAWRALREEDFIRGFKTHVELPTTIAATLMFAAWLSGNGSRIHTKNFYLIKMDLSMSIYWLVFSGALAWMTGYAIHLMFLLRRDPRSRTTATIYITAGVSGLIALFLRATQAITPALNNDTGLMIASVFGCGAVVGFALGATHSWSKKMQWFIPQPKALLLAIPDGKVPVEARRKFSPRADLPGI